MKPNLSVTTYVLFAAVMASMTYASLNLNTATMFLVSSVTFLTCAVSATHLMGGRSALVFIVIALSFGWFAEYTGERFGWFFGDYDYTDALGFKVVGVPLVIPIMWFNLCYISLVMSFLIVELQPFKRANSVTGAAGVALLGAVLVTAYDLAADPYMVYVVKAWIMDKKDGGWFGVTLQGFVGWMVVAFVIIFSFLLAARRIAGTTAPSFKVAHAWLPVALYLSWMSFWVLYGQPIETRVISAFAMGTPVLIVMLTFKHWKNFSR